MIIAHLSLVLLWLVFDMSCGERELADEPVVDSGEQA